MTNFREVTCTSTQTFVMASTMLIVIIFSSLNTITFGQSDPPVNKPPVIVVTSPVIGEINQTVVINASVSDPDGNITNIIWNQEDEFPTVNMNISTDKQSMSFVPTQNVTHVFSVEGIDNNGAATLESVDVNIGPS